MNLIIQKQLVKWNCCVLFFYGSELRHVSCNVNYIIGRFRQFCISNHMKKIQTCITAVHFVILYMFLYLQSDTDAARCRKSQILENFTSDWCSMRDRHGWLLGLYPSSLPPVSLSPSPEGVVCNKLASFDGTLRVHCTGALYTLYAQCRPKCLINIHSTALPRRLLFEPSKCIDVYEKRDNSLIACHASISSVFHRASKLTIITVWRSEQ